MNDGQQADAADVLASIGRHWGWIMAFGWSAVMGILSIFAGLIVLAVSRHIAAGAGLVVLSVWLLFYGVMEITLAFRLRSLGHRAGTRPVHAV